MKVGRTRNALVVSALIVLAGLFAAWIWFARGPGAEGVGIPDSPVQVTDVLPAPLASAPEDAERSFALPNPTESIAHASQSEFAAPNAATKGVFRLSGRVRRAEGGNPIEPIHMACRDEFGGMRAQSADVRSGFAFDALAPGLYWLVAGSDSIGYARASVDLRADRRVHMQLVLPRSLPVRVLDELGVAWMPEAGAVIVSRSDPGLGPSTIYRTTWPRRGGARSLEESLLPVPELEPLILKWGPPAFANLIVDESILATHRITDADKEIVFILRRDDPRLAFGELRFRVIDVATREPLDSCSFHVLGTNAYFRDRGAAAEDLQVPPGRWTLEIRARGSTRTTVPVTIRPGELCDLGDIAIGAGFKIRGHVTSEFGQSIWTRVRAARCDASGVEIGPVPSILTVELQANGAFELFGMEPGWHRLTVAGHDGAIFGGELGVNSIRVVEVKGADIDGVELLLQSGIPLIVRPSGRETSDSGLRVLTPEGVEITKLLVGRDAPVRIQLAPGSYDVEMWHELAGPRVRTAIGIVGERVMIDMP